MTKCLFCNTELPEGYGHICSNCEAERLKEIKNKYIFICSPYRGNESQNRKNAIEYCKQIVHRGLTPIAPHLYFPLFLNDSEESERRLGIRLGKTLLLKCSEVWVFGNYISDGMREEIRFADSNGIPIKRVLRIDEHDIVLEIQ